MRPEVKALIDDIEMNFFEWKPVIDSDWGETFGLKATRTTVEGYSSTVTSLHISNGWIFKTGHIKVWRGPGSEWIYNLTRDEVLYANKVMKISMKKLEDKIYKNCTDFLKTAFK